MVRKSPTQEEKTETPDPTAAFAQMAPVAWMSRAWIENMSDLGSEITTFVAQRISEDVRTQHAILHCKTLPELQHIQAEFMQRALDDYSAETGKLVKMSNEIIERIRSQPEAD